MAVDQRYCLQCGQRRGDPRLPFMDAVTFMDAAKRPPQAATPAPPSRRKPRMTANASLIAGVGTLLLAMGIGVLIGKTGEGSSNAGSGTQVIKVGGGAETASTAGGAEATGGENASTGGKGATNKAKSKEKLSADSSGTTKAAAEILKPAGDVKLPPPTVQKGGKCESGAAGCEGGEFTGNFFGE
jgi:hypothetical protein